MLLQQQQQRYHLGLCVRHAELRNWSEREAPGVLLGGPQLRGFAWKLVKENEWNSENAMALAIFHSQ